MGVLTFYISFHAFFKNSVYYLKLQFHQNLIRRALGLTFLILSNANWQSSFQIVGWFFLKRWKIGSHMFINLAMKRLMYYNLPRKPLISFSIFSTSMSSMALILSRSTSMPRSLTICPNSFPEVTPKVHFLGFNLNLNFWILSKNLSKASKWSALPQDFTIISST